MNHLFETLFYIPIIKAYQVKDQPSDLSTKDYFEIVYKVDFLFNQSQFTGPPYKIVVALYKEPETFTFGYGSILYCD